MSKALPVSVTPDMSRTSETIPLSPVIPALSRDPGTARRRGERLLTHMRKRVPPARGRSPAGCRIKSGMTEVGDFARGISQPTPPAIPTTYRNPARSFPHPTATCDTGSAFARSDVSGPRNPERQRTVDPAHAEPNRARKASGPIPAGRACMSRPVACNRAKRTCTTKVVWPALQVLRTCATKLRANANTLVFHSGTPERPAFRPVTDRNRNPD